ncbi:RNA-binding domain-containing protein [Lacticaseibacillus zhaodongensis]|uniref:RNA-binding domain-containing protein n=1 Tax=Lacticaseibacillus zhaodongensis TaxID=2668065 RepID=UPI0012D35995|nr:RNA-binding domain-containing protein [Lacticaseibacillus zhaodongensis]
MDIQELWEWLDKPEDDRHDFKECWYKPGQTEEFVKDIFSFVNVTHHDDCFLIIGVTDQVHSVTGVENDPNRMTQQNLIDFIHTLPIAGEYVPQLKLETVVWNNSHSVDVIRIVNTDNVPVFLNKRWNAIGNKLNADATVKMGKIYTRNDIREEQVFAREGDVNTARDKNAEYHQIEQLWRKHFRIDQPIAERYKYVLSNTDNWSYYENEKTGFLYNLDPDFNMVIESDDDPVAEAESFSINFDDPRIEWETLNLKFRQITIARMQLASLDGARLTFVVPKVTSPDGLEAKHFYRYYVEGTLEAAVQNLLCKHGLIPVSNADIITYNRSIVWFESDAEKDATNKKLAQDIYELDKSVETNAKEINSLLAHLKTRISETSQDVTETAADAFLRESNAGKYAKRLVAMARLKNNQE